MRLERFYKAKLAEVEQLRLLAASGQLPEPLPVVGHGSRPDFAAALRGERAMAGAMPHARHGARHNVDSRLAIIAEYKRASPSRGVICESLSVEDAARQYAGAGAAALSVLTEETYFHGRMDYLSRAAMPAIYADCACNPLPLLRKDFIFDPLQVQATAASPASALLLIVRLTPEVGLLRHLRELAETYGMQAVVEVFDQEDLRLARESGARIIQVNARDLQSFAVDRAACLALPVACPPESHELWVAASGISRPEHLTEAACAGYDAVLVGSALMEGGKPGAALAALLEGTHAE